MNDDQLHKVGTAAGFIAALDQSGGSTPGALANYGIDESRYSSDDEMFDLVHAMRTRIITSPSFGGDRILGAILFEMTMERTIDGLPTAEYLWTRKGIVPFLKVDKGLVDEAEGVRLMKPNPGLGDLLTRANDHAIFGTKMRSVIAQAVESGVVEIARQQFDVGLQILEAGLVPILEPEIDIACPDKAQAETMLRTELLGQLDRVPAGSQVMFKLTLPEVADFYRELIDHPRVLRVVALSGGYSRIEANRRLAENHGMTASFSRALVEGLSADQSDDEFDAMLDRSIAEIFAASIT